MAPTDQWTRLKNGEEMNVQHGTIIAMDVRHTPGTLFRLQVETEMYYPPPRRKKLLQQLVLGMESKRTPTSARRSGIRRPCLKLHRGLAKLAQVRRTRVLLLRTSVPARPLSSCDGDEVEEDG